MSLRPARLFYVLFAGARTRFALPEGSCLTLDAKNVPRPWGAPFYPLASDLGLEVNDHSAFLAEIDNRKAWARWAIHGQGPIERVLADSAAALDQISDVVLGEASYLNDLLSGRFIVTSVARGLPAAFEPWSRHEHHLALARFPGGLFTRGLAKLGHDELALACEPAHERAAAFVLRTVAREIALSRRPLALDDRRVIAGSGLELSVVARRGRPIEEHTHHQQQLATRLAHVGFEPAGLLELELLEPLLAAVPDAVLPELRKAVPTPPVVKTRTPILDEVPPEPEVKSPRRTRLSRREVGPPSWPRPPRKVPDLATLFRDGAALEGPFGRAKLRVVRAGHLPLASGRVVACDPLMSTDVEPLAVEVEPASYPVWVSVARFEEEGERVAAAALLFSDEPPVRWERGCTFGVDSGTAAFCDAALAVTLASAEDDAEWNTQAVERALARRELAIARLGRGEHSGDVAIFSSGFGDGTYVTYLGRDRAGAAVAAVVGFGVAEGDEPRAGDQDAADLRQSALEAEQEREAARLRPIEALETFAMALDVELRTRGDMSEVARILDSRVVLDRDGAKTRGRDAVLEILKATPDEIVLDDVETPEPDHAQARFSWKKDGTPGGVLRAVVGKTGRIRKLSLASR